MNILHVSSNYPPAIGGPASTVPYLAKELANLGHKVCVVTRGHQKLKHFEIIDGVRVYRSRAVSKDFYTPKSYLLNTLYMGMLVSYVIKREKIDVVHAHDTNVSMLSTILGTMFKGVKKVVKYPGDLAWEFLNLKRVKESPERFFRKRGAKKEIVWFLERLAFNSFDAVLPQSNYMKNILTKFIGIDERKVHVLPNGIVKFSYDDAYIKNLRKRLLGKGRYLIFTACRLVPWKGVDYLIEAFRDMPPEIKLIIAGSGPLEKRLKGLSTGMNIKFIGKVPHEKIQAYMRASDVFVLPSIYEPLGVVFLECMAAQTPIIATSVGGIPEIIENMKDGILVEKGNPSEIKSAVKKLLSNESLIKKIKKHQKGKYKKYLWMSVVKKYENFYKWLVTYEKQTK